MINAAKELGRTVGYKPVVEADGSILAENKIVSGRFVKLDGTTDVVVKPVLGEETDADLLGIAADDTDKLPYNGMYEVIDNFCKYGKIAAFVCGGLFTVWNDGRGAVFATGEESSPTVIGAAAGTPLFIDDTTGVLTTEEGAVASSIGKIVVGSVIKAPASVDGTLFFKAKGL